MVEEGLILKLIIVLFFPSKIIVLFYENTLKAKTSSSSLPNHRTFSMQKKKDDHTLKEPSIQKPVLPSKNELKKDRKIKPMKPSIFLQILLQRTGLTLVYENSKL